MGFRVELVNNYGYKWFNLNSESTMVWVKGFLIADGCVFQNENFAELVFSKTKSEILKICEKADGHFSIVIKNNDEVSVISDHMRSFPVFVVRGDEICITDTIKPSVIANSEFDNLQKKCFQYALFTFEEKTLFKNIEQVPAGVVCSVTANGISYSDYWQFKYSNNQIKEEAVAVETIKNGYDSLFAVCKELVGDNKVVIPLSGGYDSRLVLNGLLKNGVSKDKIITFTYGRVGYEDGVLSKQIADSMGVAHHFVDYCTKSARKFFEKKYPEFAMYAGMAVSVPCIQEWYAVNELKARGVIDENCVFMPGYGGVLPGHYVREFMLNESGNDKNKIVEHIKRTMLSNNPNQSASDIKEMQELFINSKYFNGGENVNYIEGYERMIYAEEQAKFILNATRDYEFVGCKWVTPFFFKEQYNVWGKIDNELRLGNKAFCKCMETYFLPELKEIPFTGSKVSKNAKKNNVILQEIKVRSQMLFNRSKCHYLFGMLPGKVFYTSFLKNMFFVAINHTVGCEYLKILKKIKK